MRILLPEGDQKKFMEKILSKISVTDAASLCNFSERTIRDWRREKFLMNKVAMIKLCKKAKVAVPKNFIEKNDYWYADPYLGAEAAIKKYGAVGGNPEYRKKRWREWWNNKGRFANDTLFIRKPIKKPIKNAELAEFIGIMLGDGGMTAEGEQIQITLNNRDDKEYIVFVCDLIYKLFGRKPNIFVCKDATASRLLFSSINLVDFLVELGLKKGNKVKLQVDIPDWIKNNTRFERACLRGLIDTDGCVFDERHKIKNKIYSYKRINFTNRSLNLIKSVFHILEKNGLSPKIKTIWSVQIENKEKIDKYFKIIDSHNQKHLNKYHK